MRLRPDFLIVGHERSGTLWTSATLNEHPNIASFPSLPFMVTAHERRAGEVHFFNTIASLEPDTADRFVRPLSDYLTKFGKVFADLIPLADEVSKAEFYRLMVNRYSDYCDEQRGDKALVGESSPAYTFHLDFIDSFYPSIKKICCIRDPKDKLTSWHFSNLRKGRKKEREITSAFAHEYLESRIIKEYEALLEYAGSVHCITYERMSTSPLEVTRGVLDYLEVEATGAVVEQMVHAASFEQMTRRHAENGSRKRGEEDRGESMRKGVAGDWRHHIAADLAQAIDAATTDLRGQVFEKYEVEI